MANLTLERRLVTRLAGPGAQAGYHTVIFRQEAGGRISHRILPAGEPYRPKLLERFGTYEAYAVSANPVLRHRLNEQLKTGVGGRRDVFSVHVTISYRVSQPGLLVERIEEDPLGLLEAEVKTLLRDWASTLSFDELADQRFDAEADFLDSRQGGSGGSGRNRLERLQDFAAVMGLEVDSLGLTREYSVEDWKVHQDVLDQERARLRNDATHATEFQKTVQAGEIRVRGDFNAVRGEECATDNDSPQALPPPHEDDRFVEVETFYATDRKPTGSLVPARRFGSGRGDGKLTYGVCSVSIPEDHRVGKLEGPSWRRLEFRPDPNKHVVLLKVEAFSGDRFFDQLSQSLRGAGRNEILLFLHGFNVSFEDAARRTAQMAYDLKFEGTPAFYSWPSRGALSAYIHDETTVEWTIPHLKAFLQDLADRSGAEAIHLIAHSMGNRALTRALEQLAAAMTDPAAPRFSEVVLTAPDIDADVFRQVAEAFCIAAQRVTLYASEGDQALVASRKVHGYPRAGDGGPNIVVVPGIETVDASAVDTNLIGHFYYGDNRSVLSDIFYVLRGHPPKDRAGLRARECAGGSYWAFVP